MLLHCTFGLQAAVVQAEQQAAARRRACHPVAAAAVLVPGVVAGAAVQQARVTCQQWHGLVAQHRLLGVLALLQARAALQVSYTATCCFSNLSAAADGSEHCSVKDHQV